MNDTKAPIRLVLVDDHPLIRQGLRDLLQARHHFEIVAEAGSVAEARPHLEQPLAPDVVLLDIEMPGQTGLELCHELHERRPEIRPLIVTMHDRPGYVRAALYAGARAYVLKDRPAAFVVSAVEAVAAGEMVFPHIEFALLWDKLTRRERQVAWLLAQDFKNVQVAARLGIGDRAVEAYRANIYKKLGAHSAMGIADYIRRDGITERDLTRALRDSERPSRPDDDFTRRLPD